ncbi:MAG: helix-turn-helix domain-containing protein [Anaerolineales bacterium]|nr:helix-turn-helix domain-containing protein [Anaerolineales bacterium]MCW5838427.1 helix-turn-helix domain-containing protein [Anaerolineales bacterium]MCW5886950.1 helix-turn-helix domain-containing protein [Anaerolineales bacterium]
MQATRQRILDFLSARGSATAKQMALAFGMSSQNLRHHLEILEQRQLISASQPAGRRGRGRPQRLYALAPQAQPDGLAGLSRALLHGLPVGGKAAARSLRALAQRLLGPRRPSGHGSQRLLAAMRQLEPLGYRPRWEARPEGPQVVLGHCPFSAIIAQHPELCQMDAYLLEELLDTPLEQISKLQTGPQGTPQCIFHTPGSRSAR